MNAVIKIYRNPEKRSRVLTNAIDITFDGELFVALGSLEYCAIVHDTGTSSGECEIDVAVELWNHLLRYDSWRCYGGQADLREAFNLRQPITVEELEALARKVKG